MGAFNDKVFEVVRNIPAGYVTTYGDIARSIGEPRKSRFVGYALRNNPDPNIYPCHRVVFKDGSLAANYIFGGADVQRKRLEGEGVPFVDDTHVDIARCRWTPGSDALGRPTDIDWEAEMAE
ncbi:MAG: MGMT family protein [Coriobacteriia bacterium]|nr:MGMT family protein [Coriobacteriia bacterium]